ncbi:MAG: LLM class flavin-dependent oxidoreductase [Rhodococcus fascians]
MRRLQTAIAIGGAASGRRDDWDDKVVLVREAELLDVDSVWTAEAWGQDAATPLGFLAAVTDRIRLGTNIMQVSPRTPSMTAMTALTLAAMSRDRFILGLGVSGPQVVEGLHGVAFEPAFTRLREHVDIVRLAFAGEKLEYRGLVYVLPRPGGEGKTLRLAQRPNANIPIYLGTLGQRSLEYTGEVADGWNGTSFVPESGEVLLAPIRVGAARAGRVFEEIDIVVGGRLWIGDEFEAKLEAERLRIAMSMGAMGSSRTNFYNRAYQLAGYAEEAALIQRLWRAGRRDEAIAVVPTELALSGSFIGNAAMVRERVHAFQAAGVTTLRWELLGDSIDDQLEHLSTAIGFVADLNGRRIA